LLVIQRFIVPGFQATDVGGLNDAANEISLTTFGEYIVQVIVSNLHSNLN